MLIQNEHLEHQINQRLVADPDLSSQRIDVHAKDGVVTLSGNVQSFRRKLAASQIANSDDNVVEVRNELVVSTPDAYSDVSMAEQINRLLDSADGLSNESIVVVSRAISTVVSGYVRTEMEKSRVSDIASAVDGVHKVDNLLIVNADQVEQNQQHCRRILASIAEIIGLSDENLRLSVANDAARLSGRVSELWAKEAAEKTVRSFGILTVCNDVVVDPMVE